MKTLTWNVNRASISRNETWETLVRLDADIVTLQEVKRIPDWVSRHYTCYSKPPKFFEGMDAPYQTAILSKWPMDTRPYLTSELEWASGIQSRHHGWILESQVVNDVGTRFHVVSVHLLAVPASRELLADVDISSIGPEDERKLWLSDILWFLLREADIKDGENWIVSGDFNNSVKFYPERERDSCGIVARPRALGLTDCLGHVEGGPVPTFQATNKAINYQLDYCFVNAPMLQRLTKAQVLDREEVFGRVPRLSDHLPILCEFDDSLSTA